MNKLHLLQKVTHAGVVAFGAISFAGITTTSAQAAVIGALNWGNTGTDDFITDFSVSGSTATLPETFDVIFGPDGDTTISLANGIFAGTDELVPAPTSYILDEITPAVAEFELIGGDVNGTFEYRLTNELVFDFGVGNVIIEPGGDENPTIFLGEFDRVSPGGPNATILGLELEEEFVGGVRVEGFGVDDYELGGIQCNSNPLANCSVFGEELTFGQEIGAERGGIQAGVTVDETITGVPEPSTMLGLLSVASLALSLKRKEKLSKAN